MHLQDSACWRCSHKSPRYSCTYRILVRSPSCNRSWHHLNIKGGIISTYFEGQQSGLLLPHGYDILRHHMVCILALPRNDHLSNNLTRWARLAIVYSIIRLDPSPSRRKRLHYISALFVFAWLVLTVQLFWICEPEQGWKDERNPQCVLNKQVAICQLVCECFLNPSWSDPSTHLGVF
jgi:hypothetical protein